MYIRWLGAFRKSGNLHESLLWEMEHCHREVAAEWLQSGHSLISHARVGLLLSNRAMIRRYRTDVWSEPTESG